MVTKPRKIQKNVNIPAHFYMEIAILPSALDIVLGSIVSQGENI